MARRPRKWAARIVRTAIGLMLVFCAVGTFGIPSGDETILRSFAEATDRWQVNTEFRTAAMEYCSQGSAATRARVLGIQASRIVMFIRTLPGLPKRYAANETSQEHYDDFTQGPLLGYLHLCRNQDVLVNIGCVEAFKMTVGQASGTNQSPSLVDMERFLTERQMGENALVRDLGAQQSAAALFRDTEVFSDPAHPHLFKVRTNIAPLLEGPISQLAAELHVPAEPKSMTPEQQQWVLDRLDRFVRVHNPELWRTKQLSDFFGGLWAQVYGPDYGMLIVPLMSIHNFCRIMLVLLLTSLTVYGAVRWRRIDRGAVVSNQLNPIEMTA